MDHRKQSDKSEFGHYDRVRSCLVFFSVNMFGSVFIVTKFIRLTRAFVDLLGTKTGLFLDYALHFLGKSVIITVFDYKGFS